MSTATASESARIKKDEEVARRLQEQLQSEQQEIMFRPPSRTVSKKTLDTPATSRSNSSVSDLARMAATLDDEELARRMEQEMRDEEMARNITERENQRASSRQSRQVATATPPRQGCSLRRFCCSVLPVVVVAGGIGTFLYFYLLKPDSLPDWIPDPEDFANEVRSLQCLLYIVFV